MPENTNGTWHALNTNAQPNESPYLIRYSFTSDGYWVQFTDLTQVWTENLNKQNVIARARKDETSIDPSEDNSQFVIVLQKIQAAIDGEKDTSLTINSGTAGTELRVHLFSELPRPLQPFKWALRPSVSQTETISSEVITPLLRSSYIQHHRVEELSRLLAEKDNAISKVLDKIESLGVDFHAIFPKLSATRNTRSDKCRELIARNVRGMASFEKEKWLQSFPSKQKDPITFNDLVRDAFAGDTTLDARLLTDSITARPFDEQRNAAKADSGTHNQASLSSSSSENGDDFQHQTTPPSLQRLRATEESSIASDPHVSHAKGPSAVVDDASTDEEVTPRPTPPSHGRPRLLDKDQRASELRGSHKNSTAIPSDIPARAQPRKPKLGRIGGSRHYNEELTNPTDEERGEELTTSHIDQERQSSAQLHEEPPKDTNKERPRKLGRIGGAAARQKEQEAQPDSATASTASSFSHDASDSTIPQTTPWKLGRIGGLLTKEVDQKPQQASATPDLQDDQSKPAAEQLSQSQNAPRKFGRIGGHSTETGPASPHSKTGRDAQSANNISPTPLSETPTAPSSAEVGKTSTAGGQAKGAEQTESKRSPTPVESAQEKAHRKREELKRQLEEKSRAPSKKKRRF